MNSTETSSPRSFTRSATCRLALLMLLVLTATGAAHAQRSFSMLIPTSHFVIDRTYTLLLFKQGYTEGRIRLEYSVDSMRTWKLVDTLDPAMTGTIQFPWLVPDDSTATGVLRVTVNDTMRARSALFTIGRTPIPTLRAYSPQSGSTVYAGTETTIMWYSENVTGLLVVEYSLDSGGVWASIEYVTPRDGTDSLVWSVPHVSSSRARVRVRTSDSAWFADVPGSFRILDPSLELLRPNGGEQFIVDSLEMIIWSARDLPGRLGLSYSVDDGAFWFPIEFRDAHQGLDTLYWPVPANISNTVRLRIEQEDGLDEDESDGTFRIVAKPSGVREESATRRHPIFAPNPARDRGELRWSQADAGDVRLRLYRPSGEIVLESIVSVDAPGVQHLALDLGSLEPGSYRYDIASDRHTISGCIIVLR